MVTVPCGVRWEWELVKKKKGCYNEWKVVNMPGGHNCVLVVSYPGMYTFIIAESDGPLWCRRRDVSVKKGKCCKVRDVHRKYTALVHIVPQSLWLLSLCWVRIPYLRIQSPMWHPGCHSPVSFPQPTTLHLTQKKTAEWTVCLLTITTWRH